MTWLGLRHEFTCTLYAMVNGHSIIKRPGSNSNHSAFRKRTGFGKYLPVLTLQLLTASILFDRTPANQSRRALTRIVS
jgi:hypothetical protein